MKQLTRHHRPPRPRRPARPARPVDADVLAELSIIAERRRSPAAP